MNKEMVKVNEMSKEELAQVKEQVKEMMEKKKIKERIAPYFTYSEILASKVRYDSDWGIVKKHREDIVSIMDRYDMSSMRGRIENFVDDLNTNLHKELYFNFEEYIVEPFFCKSKYKLSYIRTRLEIERRIVNSLFKFSFIYLYDFIDFNYIARRCGPYLNIDVTDASINDYRRSSRFFKDLISRLNVLISSIINEFDVTGRIKTKYNSTLECISGSFDNLEKYYENLK